MTDTVAIDALVFDATLWPRVERNAARVAHFVELLKSGVELPAIKVQQGTTIVLGGWHTAQACRVVGQREVIVEVVDVPEADRLLFAYREDMAAALPYSPADAKSVAERLYRQRSNGTQASVAQIARDLGRAQQTVQKWLDPLIEKDRQRQDRERQARALVVVMLTDGAQVSQRRVAGLLGVDEKTVRSDTRSGIAPHAIIDDQIVSLARSILAETAGRGSTDAERQAAADWLLERLNPDALATVRRLRALEQVLTWTGAARRQLGEFLDTRDLAGCLDSADLTVQQEVFAVLEDITAIRKVLTDIERRMG